eukprot:CAMPEP_0194544988 /NCGR_PEP_ID=MMETSP0253-20130528/88457_1 /TAXON_ID=2966 /ORGANISM="Noctiluca scintillans" /LENGTH=66 /DNA_ID=CAMNT_0039391941 /DNA_START=1 /DNA_END=197 /DNA_ORIENTATION=-
MPAKGNQSARRVNPVPNDLVEEPCPLPEARVRLIGAENAEKAKQSEKSRESVALKTTLEKPVVHVG